LEKRHRHYPARALTISKAKSDIGNGVVHCDASIAKALLGAEEGDEVEVLTGRYVRPAVVESIMKASEYHQGSGNT
jgi:transcription elongation GreA/GreB family factor